MQKQQIIETIKEYLTDKPVKKAYVFGSFTKKDVQYNDIDLLLDFDYVDNIYSFYYNIGNDLQKKLNIKIDIVSMNGLSKHIQPYIDQEKVLIYKK